MKYGRFTPEDDKLLLPWVGIDFSSVPVDDLAERLDRHREAIKARLRYIQQKRETEKERMEHVFAYSDRDSAEKIREVYRKMPKPSRIYFLRYLVPASDWIESQKSNLSKAVTVVARHDEALKRIGGT